LKQVSLYSSVQVTWFPILGGRLLKAHIHLGLTVVLLVSNPWREAIEDSRKRIKEYKRKVSNPWREAIEGKTYSNVAIIQQSFQSLEGGY